MRFACEACHAQYLISDEKVGPAGVKVRCKKCGHVIVVRRQAGRGSSPGGPTPGPAGALSTPGPSASAAGNSPGPAGAETGGAGGGASAPGGESAEAAGARDGGLDALVGAAIDRIATPDAAAGSAPAPGNAADGAGAPDPEATRVFSAAEISRLAQKAEEPEAPPAEWFVAIDDQQVGPISVEEVKGHWERGALGPESLCWRAGLSDWTPIARVAELFERLPPAAARTSGDGAAARAAGPILETVGSAAAAARDDSWDLPAPQPTSEYEWKPAASTALSALVQQEVAALGGAPAAAAAGQARPEEPPAPESTGIRTLLSSLPEPPAPEPSRVIPFPERSQPGTQALPRPPKTEPSRAAAAPEKGGGARTAIVGGLVAAVVVLLAVVGLSWAGYLPGSGGTAAPPGTPPAVAAPAPVPTPAPAPAPAPAVATPAPAPAPAPDPAPAAPEVAPPPAPEPEAVAAATPEPAPAPPAPVPEPARVAPAPEPTPAAPAPVERRRPERRDRRAVASTARPAPEPAPTPAPTPAPSGRRSDIDDLFEREFSGESGRSAPAARQDAPSRRGDVYIPEAPGSARTKPDKLGQGDVMAVVVGHKAAIKKCAENYKASGGGSGTLVMVWTIQPSGKTSNVRPKGSEHAPLAKCIGGLIRGWQFPSYGGPTMPPIEFPFQF